MNAKRCDGCGRYVIVDATTNWIVVTAPARLAGDYCSDECLAERLRLPPPFYAGTAGHASGRSR